MYVVKIVLQVSLLSIFNENYNMLMRYLSFFRVQIGPGSLLRLAAFFKSAISNIILAQR